MGLKVGLTYNLKNSCPRDLDSPDDADAEYESEQTVGGILTALEACGHKVVPLPYSPELPTRLLSEKPDIVFNIAEGWTGRNREALVPAMLEFFNIPYTGSDPLTLGLALDKALCKTVVSASNIPTAKWIEIERIEEWKKIDLSYPLFVKPNAEGSSKGIRNWSRVNTPAELSAKLAWVVNKYHQSALVEEFLPGREFTVGIIGNENPTVLPIIEVLPGDLCPKGEEFVYSFETKSGNLERFVCPAVVEPELEGRIKEVALHAHKALKCRDVSRVDIRLDRNGIPNFIEINPLPGLSQVSLLPLQARAAGMSFTDLVQSILQAALERYQTVGQVHYVQYKEAALG